MKQTPITINDEQELDRYTVNFRRLRNVTVTVNAIDDDDAQTLAENLINDYYGWDLTKWQVETNKHQ
jgi:Fe-S-cluster formation regulator IscX/YfhJ